MSPSVAVKPVQQRTAQVQFWPVRIIPALDEYARVVAFCQTAIGKTVLLGCFAAVLGYFDARWDWPMLFLVLTTFLPQWRRYIVTVGTAATIGIHLLPGHRTLYDPTLLDGVAQAAGLSTLHSGILLAGATVGVLSVVAAWMWVASAGTLQRTLIVRRPILSLLGLWLALALLCSSSIGTGAVRFFAWAALVVLTTHIWFIAYALSDRKAKRSDSVANELGTLQPFWGSTLTPYPKGASYWRKIEARTPEDLAVTMLKGLKLILWALVLSGAATAFGYFARNVLHARSLGECLDAYLRHQPMGVWFAWQCLAVHFVDDLLALSIAGHVIIAICRMAGFRALRNTYRPLSSRSIAEFWNRYYYYFKELLVDMFFYPTFIRCFKKNMKVRVFFATFMAAGVGNAIYHFIRDVDSIGRLGFWAALANFRVYLVYVSILAVGIAISQERSKRIMKNRGWMRGHVVPSVCVVAFFCLLQIFKPTATQIPMVGRFHYLIFLLTGR
ncbi:MAG TPA: hypothetical protein VGC88_01115 [Terriglobales bacterium]